MVEATKTIPPRNRIPKPQEKAGEEMRTVLYYAGAMIVGMGAMYSCKLPEFWPRMMLVIFITAIYCIAFWKGRPK